MSEHKKLEETIIENASGPKSVEVDGQRIEQHSLTEQIAADNYLQSVKALRSKNSGLKISKLAHSGGV